MQRLRINFNQVFRIMPDGTVEPKARMRINGVEIGPGFRFRRGVTVANIDLFRYVGRDLAITKEGDVWVIHGHYA